MCSDLFHLAIGSGLARQRGWGLWQYEQMDLAGVRTDVHCEFLVKVGYG